MNLDTDTNAKSAAAWPAPPTQATARPSVDHNAIRPGDTILVEMVVTSNSILLTASPSGLPAVQVYRPAVVGHTPRHIRVGDTVRYGRAPTPPTGKVLAISEGEAWVQRRPGDCVTFPLAELIRL